MDAMIYIRGVYLGSRRPWHEEPNVYVLARWCRILYTDGTVNRRGSILADTQVLDSVNNIYRSSTDIHVPLLSGTTAESEGCQENQHPVVISWYDNAVCTQRRLTWQENFQALRVQR